MKQLYYNVLEKSINISANYHGLREEEYKELNISKQLILVKFYKDKT